VLHASLSRDEDAKRRFLREGYVANTVAHPSVVRVIDDDVSEQGEAFIVMDLLEGETVEARAARTGGKLPPEEVVTIVEQLLDVLAAAHEKKIVHRDIKPDNVFLTRDGHVKLIDFGIARLRQPGGITTLNNVTFGTPAYMSPEQALGKTDRIDEQSDLWAVGATTFSLLAGRLVHVTETLNEQLVAHAARHAPSLLDVAPSVPPQVAAVVDRALAFEKIDRWPDARAMQRAIQAAAAELGWPLQTGGRALLTSGSSLPVASPLALSATVAHTGGARREISPLYVALGCVAAGAVIGGAYFFLRGPSGAAATASPAVSAVAAETVAPGSSSAPPPAAEAAKPAAQPVVEPGGIASSAGAASATPPVEKKPAAQGSPRRPRLPAGGKASGNDDWLNKQH
jgi:hypothetical protein